MKRQFVLTVAESKRLIGKAVAALPEVQNAMKEGTVVVATGTTNAYVLEELWGKKIDKRRYRSGITTPPEPEKHPEPADEKIPDVVFINGEVAAQYDRVNIAPDLKKGDVYIKGANVLDYMGDMAGILIGGMDGATIGNTLGHIIGKQVHLIIPIGLEKLTYEDINELYRVAAEEDYEGPRMWPITGTIITEIEALGVLAGVDAYLYSAGGIAGAEGAVRLLVEGTDNEIEETLELIKSIKGEPRYLL
ncbi:MAG: hypothetical protein NWE89_09420 [Candidatus Bathyarchaeota archaeon]|nr:hypothetical protein [Candidatus Bathyarchaeota archaeon]